MRDDREQLNNARAI